MGELIDRNKEQRINKALQELQEEFGEIPEDIRSEVIRLISEAYEEYREKAIKEFTELLNE